MARPRSDLPTEANDHFDGQRFYNPWQPRRSRRFGLWRWLLRPRGPGWPKHEPSQESPVAIPPMRSQAPHITWLGHASVLVQIAGINLISDPIRARWAGPLPGLGVRRHRPPTLDWSDLPPIDVVLVSHAHYDHLDRPTLTALIERDDPQIVAGLGLADWLARRGSQRATTLDWWQHTAVADNHVRVTAVPAQHWSRRGLFDRNRSLWLGFWVTAGDTSVYIAGDSGYGPHFSWIRERLGEPDVAVLPIGAYEPRAWMASQHMNPAEAVAAHRDLKARRSMGMHFATYRLTDEAYDAPARDLAVARREQGIAEDEFIAPAFGQSLGLAPKASDAA